MQRSRYGAMVLVTLVGVLVTLVTINEAAARVDVGVNINIGPPPAYVIPAPPSVAVIPGTYVYMVPGINLDILFYNGYWYRPHQGYWYRSRSYNGPWGYLPAPNVPPALIQLPPYYRNGPPPGYYHIPYGHLQQNWKRWDREQYWNRDREWHEGWNGGRGEEHGRGREGHGRGRD
jgi:hypothetical protein